ncbi:MULTISPECIES: helix-turn-helix domain-containing protein [Actinosynnema]|uniref:helix-turn-helix domain-containing protein n=1 Tax=Actinosynnema TaxID=40566 RepID=UPI0020A46B47|nr:helix-turn-helix domain-containing protein [Actinosynnema pretiosum]MCP2094698.1 Winged helix DNA-binding domain-containing protein [Actinosynnema pretiosum]
MSLSTDTKENDTDEKVWLTLVDMPRSSSAQIALAAGIGGSTARKALVRLHDQGRVSRISGGIAGGRRTPDHWSAVVPDDVPEAVDGIDVPQDEVLQDDVPPTPAPQDDGGPDDIDHQDDAPQDDGAAVEGTPVAPVVAVPVGVGGVVGRLAPGALRGMVEDHLRDNAGEFGPTAIGKVLNRSAGAVHNALEKLVAAGVVTRTSDKPKRYALAAQEADGATGRGR